ncbi:MAG: hypothetical protein ACRCW9_03040 [Cetobacterium sp.]
MDDVRTELKVTGAITLNDANVRKLSGKTSGEISMNDLRGKSACFDKIRFKCNAWNTKDNYGTSNIIVYDINGVNVSEWSGNPVVSTWGDITLNLKEGVYNVGKIYFRRFIDTSSGGGASMEVWLYTSYNDSWIKIITDNSYRTGRQWETKIIDHNDVTSI